MENIKDFNLNHSTIFVSDFNYGTTTGTIKAGHKLYNYCIKKNNNNTFFELWQGYGSKYINNVKSITIKNNAIIDRKIIDKFNKISDAQQVCMMHNDILY